MNKAEGSVMSKLWIPYLHGIFKYVISHMGNALYVCSCAVGELNHWVVGIHLKYRIKIYTSSMTKLLIYFINIAFTHAI